MLHVVALGECMVELAADGRGLYRQSFSGDAYNAAVYLARRAGGRVRVSFLSALGDDPLSETMLQAWQNEELDTTLVPRVRGGRPGLYMIATDAQGERSFSYWRGESAARRTMDLFEGGKLTADLLFFTGITLAIFDEPGRQKLLALPAAVRESGGRVAFDPNFRPTLWSEAEAREWIARAWQVCDIALPGMEDHRILFGHGSPEEIVADIQAAGCGEVVVKDGENGSWCAVNGMVRHIPAERATAVVDTTAAGDAFAGAYLAARLLGAVPEAAAREAARTAAFVIGQRGAITPKVRHADFLRRSFGVEFDRPRN